MPFQSSWYIEKRIRYVELTGELSVEDLRGIIKVTNAVEETDGPIHSITDIAKLTKFPTNPMQLGDVFKGYDSTSTSGWSVVVSNNVLANFALVIVSKFSDARFQTVSNIEEALKFLCEIDPTVEPLIREKQRDASNG